MTACKDLVIMELSDFCRSSISWSFEGRELDKYGVIDSSISSESDRRKKYRLHGIKNSQTQTEQVHTLN